MPIKDGYSLVSSTDIVEFMQAEIERTGFGFQRALKGNSVAKNAGLNSGVLYSWLRKKGESEEKYSQKLARKDHIELARTLWMNIVDKEEHTKKEPKKPLMSTFKVQEYKSPSQGYIPITPEFLTKLAEEEKRTGVPARDVIISENIDVSPYTVNSWRTESSYRTRSTDPKVIAQLLAGYAKLTSV